MNIPRKLLKTLETHLSQTNKGVVVYGSRQVGKTTLVNTLIKNLKLHTLVLDGDQRGPWWELLTSRDLAKIKLLTAGYDAVFIDEAQRINEIGLNVKIILDNIPGLKVMVTGSSALDLASKVSEPLTGRVYSYKLFPISVGELSKFNTELELHNQLEERLVFGSYPEIFSQPSIPAKIRYLENLTNAHLYRDMLEFGGVRNSGKVYDLLKLLSFQVGSQVSLSELAGSLGISRNTVDRYLDLLEKSFVVFRLSGYSRNLRREVRKMDKVFFYDLGVRNAVIGNFNLLANRNDVGALWENFLIMERIKKQAYAEKNSEYYYWRLSSGAEIDLVEEQGGSLDGFEFKYSKPKGKPPASWLSTYENASWQLISRDNWLEFVV